MAATTSKATKRKSTESTEQMLKKIKVAKSAERPQPQKSALKTANANAKTATPSAGKPKGDNKSKASATSKAPAKVTKPQKGRQPPKEEAKSETAAEKIQATKDAIIESAAAKAKSAKESAKKESAAAAKAAKNVVEDTIAVSKSAKSAAKDKKTKSKAEEELLDSDDEEEEAGAALTADQTAALIAGFSSSDEDSDEEDGIPISKLPKAPIDKAHVLEAADAAALTKSSEDDPETTPGVVYVGRIPHGFYEKQMHAYFGQFGTITHLRLARSKKTARSRHYAFVEFASAAVADIVAKTMDKYLMFNHILQVRRVPKEQLKENIWQGEGRKKRPMPINRIEGIRLNKGTSKEGWEKRITRETKKRKSATQKLAEIGYEFVAPVLKALGQGGAPVEASSDKQLLEDVQQAADEQPAKNLSNSGKKRAAASAAAPEGKKTKKAKAKA